MEGRCTFLSPPNFTLRGYSDGKDKSRRPETRRELQRAARDPNIAGNCLDARTQSGFEFGEPLLAELQTRDTSHSCPGSSIYKGMGAFKFQYLL